MAGVADVVIFGGTAAISDAVEANLNNWGYGTWRIAGATRYDTAAEVAEYGVGIAGLGWNRVGIATGENYPDALAGGVLAVFVAPERVIAFADAVNGGEWPAPWWQQLQAARIALAVEAQIAPAGAGG
mgnify:CR=1 FL=1